MLWFSKALVPAFLPAVFAAGASAPAFRPDDYLRHVRFLAGDEMRGRGNGTPELDKAADYVAAGFEAAGLRPARKTSPPKSPGRLRGAGPEN